MRIVVTGGRAFMDKVRVHSALSKLHSTRGPITYLAEGGQREADWWAATRWKGNGVPGKDRDGDTAGLIRNGKMIEGGKPGTAVPFLRENGMMDNMLLQRRMACLEIIEG